MAVIVKSVLPSYGERTDFGKVTVAVPGLSTCFEVRSIVTASARCADTRPPRRPPWECVASVAQRPQGFPVAAPDVLRPMRGGGWIRGRLCRMLGVLRSRPFVRLRWEAQWCGLPGRYQDWQKGAVAVCAPGRRPLLHRAVVQVGTSDEAAGFPGT
jgi:hypothetical protein